MEQQIKVLFANQDAATLPAKVFEQYLKKLPSNMQQSIQRMRRPQDRVNRLSGYTMLKQLAIDRGAAPDFLHQIQKDKNGRPFHPSGWAFNISHSHQCAVVVMAPHPPVGIDIEWEKELALKHFRQQFSDSEWRQIQEAENRMSVFYRIWTAKEAIAKADGRGLGFAFDQVLVEDQIGYMDGKNYQLNRLQLCDNYFCTLAHRMESATIAIKEASLKAY